MKPHSLIFNLIKNLNFQMDDSKRSWSPSTPIKKHMIKALEMEDDLIQLKCSNRNELMKKYKYKQAEEELIDL